MAIEIRELGLDDVVDFLTPVTTAFGNAVDVERAERLKTIPEFELRLAAFDEGSIVGAAGSFSFELTTPGGVVPTGGLTMVGVLPSHRRRGVLRSLMRRYLDGLRKAGRPVSALWASEAPIYGRFGYGMASFQGETEIQRSHAAFALPVDPEGRVRLVDEDEAAARFPAVWEQVRLETPGMLSRSTEWWRVRRVGDAEPEGLRGRGPLQRLLLEHDGAASGYALYRLQPNWEHGVPATTLHVVEAMATTPAAVGQVWRFLLDVDIVRHVAAWGLPVDHPLLLLAAEPRRLGFRLSDGLWVRLVDVGAALAERTYGGTGAVVLDVIDSFCPWNEARWRLEGGGAERTRDDPDLRLDVGALGSAYLGGFTFAQLARAGRVRELADGAVRRADRLFYTGRAPWCPEIF
ncbi:MAG: GNAT family N-acetyltransferase [Actinomycetota bacterium]|nr:GNAT family N-acetyltransferase [Actinomycetota bacterium]